MNTNLKLEELIKFKNYLEYEMHRNCYSIEYKNIIKFYLNEVNNLIKKG